MKRIRSPTVVDLFCGAGGFSLGFQAAGARILAAVDANERAGATFRTNFGLLQPRHPPIVLSGAEGNLERVDLERLAPSGSGPDILIGGPPCQGFSRVGRSKLASLAVDPEAGDSRNNLYLRFVAAARFWRPSLLVMENVPGMLSLRGENVAESVAMDLADCGYRVGYALLNAVWYGAPQFRERLFFIGIRDDVGVLPSAPRPTHHVALPSGYLRPHVALTLPLAFVPHFELEVSMWQATLPATTAWQALADLPPITEHLSPGAAGSARADFRRAREFSAPATSAYAELMRSWPGLSAEDGLRDHVIRRTPRDYETFRRMDHDDRYPEAMRIAEERFAELLRELAARGEQPVPGSAHYSEIRRSIVPPYPVEKFVDKWRKLSPGKPSWTVPAHLAKDAYSHIHYDSAQARGISVREAARLQTFPDGFAFEGNMGDCFTQIGNAVPPLLAWSLAVHLMELLGNKAHRPPSTIFPESARAGAVPTASLEEPS